MKVAPVSADLLIKIGLTVAVIGVAYWSVKKVTGAAGEAGQAVSNTLWKFSPTNNDNVISRGFNWATGGDNETNSIGTRIYDGVDKVRSWFNPPETIAKPYQIPQDFGVNNPNAPW